MKRKNHRFAGDEETEEDSSKKVKQLGNKVYFYADVTMESVQQLFECLNEANSHAVLSTPSTVHLHISSNGGDAWAGFSAYHHLRRNPVVLTTYVDGMVASAATFLLMAGSRRVCMKYGFVLIHQVSTGFFGKYNEMIDEMANTHDLMQACRSLYAEHTKMNAERLEELLKSERAVNATSCLEDGIVHLIE